MSDPVKPKPDRAVLTAHPGDFIKPLVSVVGAQGAPQGSRIDLHPDTDYIRIEVDWSKLHHGWLPRTRVNYSKG